MPEDPGDAEVSGSGGIDDDGLGLDAWVSDDGPAGVDGDAVMERPRRRDLARFHVRPRVRPVLGESPPERDCLAASSGLLAEGVRSAP